jgi:hypothetical protein
VLSIRLTLGKGVNLKVKFNTNILKFLHMYNKISFILEFLINKPEIIKL